MTKQSIDYALYLVTASYDYSEAHFLQIIREACAAGVTVVQLREKTASTRDFYELALKVKAITEEYGIPLIINDRLDICLAVDAQGLHIGDEELPVAVCRKLLGPDKILGVSAKTLARAQEAQAEGADYLGVGAMYPTKTKETPLTAFATLEAIIQGVHVPVVAIGGVKEENVMDFQRVPIHGLCMVSEIMQADNVTGKVRRLRQKILDLPGLQR
ncbi:thiamine phosphate synthase [Enterococcus asini]|uniref:thiamine phosphate synthase n=1 Tax=Enterococcus asini TaxID=57732 RepID=UPI0022DFDB05|nr:thiamine phosphate synthase [Enterococcus asini]